MDRWSSNWLSTSRALPGIRAQRTWLKHTVIPQTITHIHLGGPAPLPSPVLYYHWEWLHRWWWEEQSIGQEATAKFRRTRCLMAPLVYNKHYLHHYGAAELWPFTPGDPILVYTRVNTHVQTCTHMHKTHLWIHKCMSMHDCTHNPNTGKHTCINTHRCLWMHTGSQINTSVMFWMGWYSILRSIRPAWSQELMTNVV